jgi:hypothetical protein
MCEWPTTRSQPLEGGIRAIMRNPMSVFIETQLAILTDNTALARGAAVRYRGSGAELE